MGRAKCSELVSSKSEGSIDRARLWLDRARVEQSALDSVLVRICSDCAIMWCITLLFIVMFIVIVNWGVKCDLW